MKKLNVNINGNRKLQNTDKIRYMIWNLPAEKTCPFATEHCKKSCYAKKAERIYKNVLASRQQNLAEAESIDFVENMIYTIEHHLRGIAFRGKKTVFRIHESGDFYNMEYTRKWLKIVKHFEHDPRIIFLAYTKSLPFFIGSGYGKTLLPRDPLNEFPTNIIIRSSIWEDTQQKYLDLTKVYNFPVYTALTENEINTERENGRIFDICTCENCSTCGKCWNKNKKDIIVKIH